MTADDNRKYTPAPGVHSRRFDDELVLLDLANGQYYGLNEVGAAIWERLATGASLAAIADALVAEYDVTRGRLEAEMRELVDSLVARRLLVEAP
jgi:hypothetical protein